MFVPTALRAFYLVCSAMILLVQSIPELRGRLLAYGKTTTTTTDKAVDKKGVPKDKTEEKNVLSRLHDYTAGFTVPHGYFTHFYALAVGCMVFWGVQICTHGPAYRLVRDLPAPGWAQGRGFGEKTSSARQSIHQVVLTWFSFLLQVVRRLYECVYVQKQGRSRMWVTHYLLGIAFYVAMGISVWIEGTDAIDRFSFTPGRIYSLIGPPSAKSFFGVLLFIVGSGLQHDCHGYLASLEKYTLPTHPAFERIVCPHYFAECLIYLGLAIMSAPTGPGGGLLNKTLATSLVFVAVNLGVTSIITRDWYEAKFGNKALERRWNMIPLLF